MNAIKRWIFRLAIVAALIVCAPFLYLFGVAATTPAGIGPVEEAHAKIKQGMTKDELRSLLGRPHRVDADVGGDWDYWETRFVGSILRIHFGPDDRVTTSEWWVQ